MRALWWETRMRRESDVCVSFKEVAAAIAHDAPMSTSTVGGTRKAVNYARPGQRQRKLWWRPVAVLTCKSMARAGYRGERLIELPSSWFPLKFPSG